MDQEDSEFGDVGDSFADGDPTLDDIDVDAVSALQARFDQINALDDPAEQKAAMKALVAEMHPEGGDS
ncbi:hypothetical protein [Desertimonas flava]|uniref:hypothetical protein n=1 Tax=Desertimonas flava TaxID=2064846 RepID=UPI000E354EDE|nr:hypothetical protein [Desertimonas flava]